MCAGSVGGCFLGFVLGLGCGFGFVWLLLKWLRFFDMVVDSTPMVVDVKARKPLISGVLGGFLGKFIMMEKLR